MPSSVNVNEGSYDAFARQAAGAAKRDALTNQDNFASGRMESGGREFEFQDEEPSEGEELDRPDFLSADPHRTLRPLADLILPKPARESEATLDRGFRRGSAQTATAQAPSIQTDLGPCLYFGPAGERCDRRAVEDGFCARHQQLRADWSTAGTGASLSIPQVAKRAVGAAGILAVLWPILADLIRELIRLVR